MELLNDFKGVQVLVIGDVMLDRYWWGNVTRISPEAPVPVVKMRSASLSAGGAANVAANIAGLGATASLVGIVGDDPEGSLLPGILEEAGVSGGHLITLSDRPTTVKTRIVAHGQQVARIDQESDQSLSAKDETSVRDRVAELIETNDVVVISDYAKGFLTDPLLSYVISTARSLGKPVLVDPKGKDYRKYAGATLLTPNRREAFDACGIEENRPDAVSIAGYELLSQLSLDAILITQGEDGMTLFRAEDQAHHLHARARQVYDVTGAGDTVIAAIAVALGSGMDLVEAANVANIAAGLVVETVGTTAITAAMLAAENSQS